MLSPQKSYSFSMAPGCTAMRFGDFFLSRITIEKSFFPYLRKTTTDETMSEQIPPTTKAQPWHPD
jgi:hypothetical protein